MEPVGTGVRRLGRYHLGEPAGGGPTGEVYRARVHGVAGFERQFALKRFHRQLIVDDTARAALRAAARLYAGLEHPRIARLHEHNFETQTPYVAVEWVAGLDLARLVDATFGQGRPLPAGAATSVLSRAARAVGYAHGRGHAHLGLAPTNLICTVAGEVKVTDFGFLPARLGRAPADDSTLTARLVYLAPEQLRGEATSPATDVFCLGALFFELLAGKKAFTGRSGRDISAAILGAKPDTDAIPKPLARVLDRCFAQSPFERYPSGGALADAIDAASRGMLMRGDQRDAAKAVQEATERLEKLREDQVSGALSFPIPAPPSAPLGNPGSSAAIASQRSLGVPNLELNEIVGEEQTTDVLPADALSPPPLAATLPDAATLPKHPPVPPQPPALSAELPPMRPPRTPPSHGASSLPPMPRKLDPSLPPVALSPPPTLSDIDADPEVTSPFMREDEELTTSPSLDSSKTPRQIPLDPPRPQIETPAESDSQNPLGASAEPPERPPSNFGAGLIESSGPTHLGRRALIALTLVAFLAIGFFGFLLLFRGDDDKGEKPAGEGSGTAVAAATPDAGAAAALDAAVVEKPIDAAPTADAGSTELKVKSDPRRALVYLDGTKIGKTPIDVEVARDQHKLVLIRAGHKIHIQEINGGGELEIEMEEVTPSGGPAGIKVRCRQKNRYYVWVDGKETGQLCPTERIEVDLGPHNVEVYDPVTDSRRRFDVEVTQTRRSHRIRVDF